MKMFLIVSGGRSSKEATLRANPGKGAAWVLAPWHLILLGPAVNKSREVPGQKVLKSCVETLPQKRKLIAKISSICKQCFVTLVTFVRKGHR